MWAEHTHCLCCQHFYSFRRRQHDCSLPWMFRKGSKGKEKGCEMSHNIHRINHLQSHPHPKDTKEQSALLPPKKYLIKRKFTKDQKAEAITDRVTEFIALDNQLPSVIKRSRNLLSNVHLEPRGTLPGPRYFADLCGPALFDVLAHTHSYLLIPV